MKKNFKKVLAIALSIMTMMVFSAPAFAADLNTATSNTPLEITNNTGMFKAVSASVLTEDNDSYLVVALSGSGYHNLYKGTYEEAVANGDVRDNWIAGYENAEGKWEFKIPLENGQTFVPVVAISQSYLDKYEAGQNPLARAFYPRQMEINYDAKTLVTDDWDQSVDLAVKNDIKMFLPGEVAQLRTIGGPNSNNYAELLTLNMGSASMTKVKYGEADTDVIELGEGNVFAEIPVSTFEEPMTLEFWSANKEQYYPRSLVISKKNNTVWFFPEATEVDGFSGKTVEEAVALAKASATPELLNKLIEAIQVQYRDSNTDAYCAAAKACYDTLVAKGVDFDDDGYFSDDTGDASADDPLNTAPDKKKELLVVSFGTSFNDSRVATIGGVEKALADAYGADYAVRRAFTAQIIINHVASRDGEQIDNVKQAMDKAVEAGVTDMIVQPTHLMSGAEYDELKEEIDKYDSKIKISYAKPLLNSDADKEAVAKAVVEEAVAKAGFENLDAAAADKTAFVFMGHGTSHAANATYTYMQQTMDKLGYDNCFVGTVEGLPEPTALPEVKKAVEAKGYTKVILRPLMVVAGDHANNDMAADEEGSWYYAFVNGGEFEVEGQDQPVDIGKGFGAENVTCQINGLGEIPAVQAIYVAHTKAAIPTIAPPVVKKSQTLKVAKAQLTKTAKAKTLKKKAVYTTKVKVTGAKTTISYAKVGGSKKLTIVKTGKNKGKIKIKKGTKKGLYKIKIKITAKATAKYKKAVKTVTVKVRVK